MINQFVVRRDGNDIATGQGRGRLKRATIDVSADIPLVHQVFLFWLIGARHRPGKRIPGGSAADGPIPGSTGYGASGATNVGTGGGFDVGPT
ncbi:MAG TPA: hypothetical protein VK059_04545 [Nocardioidaceae bacterium]|nr:hypothetical protein [Nocardioidaceae bacterium]